LLNVNRGAGDPRAVQRVDRPRSVTDQEPVVDRVLLARIVHVVAVLLLVRHLSGLRELRDDRMLFTHRSKEACNIRDRLRIEIAPVADPDADEIDSVIGAHGDAPNPVAATHEVVGDVVRVIRAVFLFDRVNLGQDAAIEAA